MSAPDGLVVAIYGAWGLGKTSVLNFVEHYLDQEQPDEFVVIRFNPWWFSGRVDLASALIDELLRVFKKWGRRGRAARKHLARLGRVVGAAVRPGVGNAVARLIQGEPEGVRALKKKLTKALTKQDKRLLIVIDDIDRLAADEIAELFAVVKALADFPNTIYLLAFDDDQVANALSARTGQEGAEYLDKIVQVPFELPLPERAALRALLLEHVRDIVGVVDTDLLENEELSLLMTTSIGVLMTTPRDIVRLTNALRVSYGAVRGEVNVAHFIALETLRIFTPNVYGRIRARPDLFGVVGGLARALPQSDKEAIQAFHAGWASEIADADVRESAKQIVAGLFPAAAGALDVTLVSGWRPIDTRRSRAASEPDYFPLYFRLALGDEALSRQALTMLIDAAADPAEFSRELLLLAGQLTNTGRTRASVMLDELIPQAERFPLEHVPGIVGELANIGDQLWIERDHEFFGLGNEDRLMLMTSELLRRIPENERCPAVKAAIEAAGSVATPVLLARRLIRGVGAADGGSTKTTSPEELDERQGLISIACAQEIERAAAELIARAAANDRLPSVPRLGWVLAEWRRWGEPDSVREWMARVVTDDVELARFLLAMRSERVTTKGVRYRLDPRWLDDYVDREGVAAAVRRLRAVLEDGDAASACDQYLLELEMLEQGKDPENRFDW